MAHQIIFEVDATGKATVAVQGMPGPGCMDALQFLEELPVEVTESGNTAEWYAKPDRESGQRLTRHAGAA